MNLKAKRDISRKLKVLNHALESKNVSRTCRYFGVSRESFYTWRRAYEQDGEEGLINNKPCPENPNLRRKRRYLGRYFAHPMMQNRRAKRDDYKSSAVRVTQRYVP
ncbi:helix-turn-helix domain-containing protein [Piscirickettsia salmonis]|uniref:helix-turn-helix domain-containing protein n=1 Tax=Piscirickettsia salmonis TaxID=1238 RepID=UPI0012BA943B|nr:helix-turn-helix domain-containing protein [Piscirickettsia salmonis]QGP60880.1 hypothetical protein PsalBI1_03502 [Piscirickettsia salmonis]